MGKRPQFGVAWIGFCRGVALDNDQFHNVHSWRWDSDDSPVLVGWDLFVGWGLVGDSCIYRMEQRTMRVLE